MRYPSDNLRDATISPRALEGYVRLLTPPPPEQQARLRGDCTILGHRVSLESPHQCTICGRPL